MYSFLVLSIYLMDASFSVPSPKKYSIHYAFFGSPHTFSNRWGIGPGEYGSNLLDNNNHRWYNFTGFPTAWGGGVPDSFISVYGGAHHSVGITSSHHAWTIGGNTYGELGLGDNTDRANPVMITVDSLGNPFDHIIKVIASGTSGWATFFLKDNGKVYGTGDLGNGVRNNGTYGGTTNRPVQISPDSIFVVDIEIGQVGTDLDSAGHVHTWGGANVGPGWTPYIVAQGNGSATGLTYKRLNLPSKIRMIAGCSGFPNYAIGTNDRIYAWSYYLNYIGSTALANLGNYGYNPIDVTDSLQLAFPIDTIVVNSQMTYAILTDSSLWSWGSKVCSGTGDGTSVNMRTYVNLSGGWGPYGYDQGYGENMQIKPSQMMAGKKNFTKIFGSPGYNYWWTAEDVHDSVFAGGRNKGNVLGNMNGGVDSISGSLQEYYPNSWDVRYATYINRFWTMPHIVRSGCPLCAPADSPTGHLCSTYPVSGSNPAPTASAGSNQNISGSWTTLKGSNGYSGTTSGIWNVLWTCIAKPAGAPNPIMPLQANDTVNVAGLQQGKYTFQYSVTSSDFKTTNSTVDIQIGCPNCFIRSPGYRHKYINL